MASRPISIGRAELPLGRIIFQARSVNVNLRETLSMIALLTSANAGERELGPTGAICCLQSIS